MTAVLKGLDAGSLVAADHLQRLGQGQRVRVRRGANVSNVAGRGNAPGAGAELQ
jgi:hypothetical protein